VPVQIDKLLEETDNLKVKIIFTSPNKPEHLAYKPVSHLMAIAQQSNGEKKINQALDDWYLSDKKDYDLFAAKYRMNGELTQRKAKKLKQWANGVRK
jgi:hypothetical protein